MSPPSPLPPFPQWEVESAALDGFLLGPAAVPGSFESHGEHGALGGWRPQEPASQPPSEPAGWRPQHVLPGAELPEPEPERAEEDSYGDWVAETKRLSAELDAHEAEHGGHGLYSGGFPYMAVPHGRTGKRASPGKPPHGRRGVPETEAARRARRRHLSERVHKFAREASPTDLLRLPTELSEDDRRLVHELAQACGLSHLSKGKGKSRHVCLSKPSALGVAATSAQEQGGAEGGGGDALGEVVDGLPTREELRELRLARFGGEGGA